MAYDDGSDLGKDWSEFENSLGNYLTAHATLTVTRLQQVITTLTQLARSKQGAQHVTVEEAEAALSQHRIEDLPLSVTRKLLSSVTAAPGHKAMSARDFEKVMLRVSGRFLHLAAYEE